MLTAGRLRRGSILPVIKVSTARFGAIHAIVVEITSAYVMSQVPANKPNTNDTTVSAENKHSICLSWQHRNNNQTTLRQTVVVGPEATLHDIETQARYVSSMDKIILKSGFPPRRLVIDRATNARLALPAQTLVTVELDDNSICDMGNNKKRSGGDTRSTRDAISRKRPLPETFDAQQGKLGSEGRWTCAACTFLNPTKAAADVCETCGTANSIGRAGWNCPACTLWNEPDARMCNNACCSGARVERSTAEQTARRVGESAAHHVSASRDETTRGPPPPLPSTITVVSYNVAGYKPSFSAPTDFFPIAAFASEILKHEPDVICLQEVPSSLTHVLRGYLPLGSTPSHCETVVLLVREEWAHHAHRLPVSAPAVLCQINLLSKTGVEQAIVFGSCHLAPFKEGASERMDQTKNIVRAVPENHPFVFAGDFNMRANEDEKVEDLGFQDVWKEAGMEYSQKFTWDSIDHTEQEGGSYNRYHERCYSFNCRFDRVYLKPGANEMLSVKHFRLIGNKPLTNNKHFLSDHFGMVATFDVRK